MDKCIDFVIKSLFHHNETEEMSNISILKDYLDLFSNKLRLVFDIGFSTLRGFLKMHQAWICYFKIMQILHLNVMWWLVRRCGRRDQWLLLSRVVDVCLSCNRLAIPPPAAWLLAPPTPPTPPPPLPHICHPAGRKWKLIGAKKAVFGGNGGACWERCGCISMGVMFFLKLQSGIWVLSITLNVFSFRVFSPSCHSIVPSISFSLLYQASPLTLNPSLLLFTSLTPDSSEAKVCPNKEEAPWIVAAKAAPGLADQ